MGARLAPQRSRQATRAPGALPFPIVEMSRRVCRRTRLKRDSKARRDVVREVVGAEEFSVVVGVGADAIVPMNGKARTDQHAVATDLRTADREAIASAARKARNKRVVGVPKFVLPGKTELWDDLDGSNLPIVGGFRAKGRAEGFRVLTRIRQGSQRTAFAKAVKANEGILETRRGANAQTALLPVVASRPQAR